MPRGQGGAIVNLSSAAARIGGGGQYVDYAAAKGAIRLMSKAAAVHCAQNGDKIRVNSVHPGFIETDMLAQGGVVDNYRDKMVRSVPVGRLGQPEDIANMVLYLASDAASYVTGQEFVVDGGVHG